MMNYDYQPFGWVGLGVMMLWWVLVVAGLVMLVRWLVPRGQQRSRDDEKSPMEILKERYARGEIDKKEFEEKKKDLA